MVRAGVLPPVVSGNFSARLTKDEVLVTASGCHKGNLCEVDFLRVDLTGKPQNSERKPSAETLLHTHSVVSTVLSRVIPDDWMTISGYEMQKSLAGNHSHLPSIQLAILDNTQDMMQLASELAARWQQ